MTEAQLQEIKTQLIAAHEYCVIAFALRGVLDKGADRYEELMQRHTSNVQKILLGGTLE